MLPVSLVIPTRNRGRLLRETLESILAGDELPEEIVLADQSDEPDDLERLVEAHECELVHVRVDGTGASRARNAAVAAASRPVLVFTDDDVLADKAWLRTLVAALLAGPERGAVSGAVLPAADADAIGYVPSVTRRTEPELFSGRLFADVLFSNNMALRRSAFDEVGLFDERLGPGSPFRNAEDNDLGFRLLEAGYRIAFVPDAILHHRAWRDRRAFVSLNWDYGFGQGAFYAKHSSLRDRHMLLRLGRNAAWRVRRIPHHLRGDRLEAVGDAVYLVAMLAGTAGWLVRVRLLRGSAGRP